MDAGPLDRFRVRRASDIVVCREHTRVVACALGLHHDDAARAATAAAEAARAVADGALDGEVTLELAESPRPALIVIFRTAVPIEARTDASWDPLQAALMLSDFAEQTQTTDRNELRLFAYAPAPLDVPSRLLAVTEALARLAGEPTVQAMRTQNRELARLLEEVRRRGRELERMNEELRAAHNAATANMLELRELARKKDEFAAQVAHDLRSPLSAMRGALDLLADPSAGPLGEEQARYLEIARRSAGHMADLLHAVLESSLLDAGLAHLRPGPICLRSVLDEVAPTIAFLAREKAIGFEVRLPDGLPHILGDAHKIGQILANLLTNAVKFTEGGGRVRVSAAIHDQHQVVVDVSDTGVGIPPGRLVDLFDKVRRAPSRGTRGERGTGLGLHICRQLIELHGGELSVESALGRGTTFTFTLPYTVTDTKETSAP